MQIISGKVKKPFNVLLYGQAGAGKSTWASQAPSPVFIAADELDELEAQKLPKVKYFTYKYKDEKGKEVIEKEKKDFSVIGQLEWLLEKAHDFKTVVVDTIDAIEQIVHMDILASEKSDKTRSMAKAAGGYSQAFGVAANKLAEVKDLLERLRDEKKMNVIIICHSVSATINDPLLGDSYNEYSLALDKRARPEFVNWVSAVLFIAYDINKGDKDKFAYGTGNRYIYTQKKPGFEAKNRYHLEPVLACPEKNSFASFWQGLKKFYKGESPKAQEVIASINELLVNTDNQAVIDKCQAMISKHKNNPEKLLKVKSEVQAFIGG